MKKIEIKTEKAPLPVGAYSQGLIVGNRVYVAGQGPLDPETGKYPEGIENQTRQVLKNITNILAEGGATLDDVVKMTAHLTNFADFSGYDRVCKEVLTPPYPTRTTVCSGLNHILVEVDVIAELDR